MRFCALSMAIMQYVSPHMDDQIERERGIVKSYTPLATSKANALPLTTCDASYIVS